MTNYDFGKQLNIGAAGEAALDAFFVRWYVVIKATAEDQRRGIDRTFINRMSQKTFTVEYKTDSRAHQTGNAFIETETYPDRAQSGWAYTSQADWLFYFVPQTRTVYIVHLATMRTWLPKWEKSYPTRKIPNANYQTHGLLVPLDELRKCASEIVAL